MTSERSFSLTANLEAETNGNRRKLLVGVAGLSREPDKSGQVTIFSGVSSRLIYCHVLPGKTDESRPGCLVPGGLGKRL